MKLLLSCLGLVAFLVSSPVKAETVLGTPISRVPYEITKSGNYHFEKNLTMVKGSNAAITISASNVNLDFNGYTLTASGTTNAAGGIGVSIKASNVAVRDGTIIGFGVAVDAANLGTPQYDAITLEDLTCESQVGFASFYIFCTNGVLSRCHVTNPSGGTSASTGFYINFSATVEDCSVADLNSATSPVLGFVIHDSVGTGQTTDVLRHCTVSNLTAQAASPQQGGVWYGSNNTVVDDCYFYNLNSPIEQGGGSIIVKNSSFRGCGSSLAGGGTDGGENTFVP